MTAPSFLTWEGGDDEDPRRPSTDDLGGDQKEDDAEFPPDPVEHFTAAGWNQLVKQVAALAKVAPACKLEVRFNAGAPYVARVTAPSGDVAADTFTVTDDGTGITTIEWPANTFPPHQLSPSGLTFLSSLTTRVEGHVEEVTNGVTVYTFSNGAAADIAFTLEIN